MTDNDKTAVLKAWVEKAIDGGWNFEGKISEMKNWGITKKEDVVEIVMTTQSLPDLIADADFMRSVYGDELVCIECGMGKNTKENKSAHIIYCNDIAWQPIFQFHQQQLIIILPDDERLEYIKRSMG